MVLMDSLFFKIDSEGARDCTSRSIIQTLRYPVVHSNTLDFTPPNSLSDM